MIRLIFSMLLILFSSILLSACLGSSGVSSGIKITNYVVGRNLLIGKEGISSEDLSNLDEGKLYKVRKQYESLGRKNLSNGQLKLLCDLYTKFNDFSATLSCLDLLEERANGEQEALHMILGRRALLFLQSGEYGKAAQLSQNLESDGGQYVNALAKAYLGKNKESEKIALKFSRFQNPKKLYFATAIYMALGDSQKALKILTHPRNRLLKDYGLMPYTNKIGQTIRPGVFRMDLFGEFDFGFFEAFSFAPKANVYVEFMAAKAFAGIKNNKEALERFTILIDSVGEGTFRDILWISYFERGKLREIQGDHSGAINDYRKAIDLIEGIRSTLNSETGRIGFSENKSVVYNRIIKLLVHQGHPEEAIEIVERFKGRTLVDMLSSKNSFAISGEDPSYTPDLLENLAEAEANLLSASSDLESSEMSKKLAALTQARKRLETEAPSLASLVTVYPASYKILHGYIRKNETALVFHHDKDLMYAFAIDATGIAVHTIPMADLVKKVTRFRQAIEEAIEDMESVEYLDAGRMVYDLLIHPLRGNKAWKRLSIIPSGPLHYLPFSALPDSQNRLLVETSAIRILPNLTIIPLLSEQISPIGNNYLVFGNPDRGDSDFDLPGTEAEAIAIAALFKSARVLLGKDATAYQFKEKGIDYSYIHVASHGEFHSDNPLESRLLLAPYGGDSGDVKVNDLYGMRLSAKLVVLSACETALSHISPGDELIGLQRGLLYAGASGMIGSLWSIADESTITVMINLYRYLDEGWPPDKALQQAQLDGRKKYPHPFFWAPFIYTGNINRLKLHQNESVMIMQPSVSACQ